MSRKGRSSTDATQHWRIAQEASFTELASTYNAKEIKPKTDGQAVYMDAMRKRLHTICVGPSGTGKAQPLHSLIRVPYGWKTMGSIKVGDEVMAADGTVVKVNGVYPQGVRPVYRIDFADGASAECCSEHLWSVYERQTSQWKILTTQEISEKMKVKYHQKGLYVPLCKLDKLPDVPLPIDPYLLGLLLGDGGLTNNVTFTTNDAELLEWVERIVTQYNCRVVPTGSNIGYGIRGHRGNYILESLRALGIHSSRSHEKFIPDIYMNASSKQRLAIVQGLMDTDGTIDHNGTISYCSTSLQLARNFQSLVRSLGGLARITKKETTFTYMGVKKNGKTAYNVNVRYSDRSTLMKLQRKINRCSGEYQYADLKRRIEKITLVGDMETQCISIEHPDHLYITNDYVVTHNTYLASYVAYQMLQAKKVDKILLTRPLVQCGKGYGFLPGDKEEKLASYFRPLLDCFRELMSPTQLARLQADKSIEWEALEDLRGTTIRNTFVICDEAQNTEYNQLHMLLTRYGPGSRYVICGDTNKTQIDSRNSGPNPLAEVVRRAKNKGVNPDVGIVQLSRADIVRHGLVQWWDEVLTDDISADFGFEKEVSKEDWRRLTCPKCKSTIWYDNGDELSPDFSDEEGVVCWDCKTAIGLWNDQDKYEPHIAGSMNRNFYCKSYKERYGNRVNAGFSRGKT